MTTIKLHTCLLVLAIATGAVSCNNSSQPEKETPATPAPAPTSPPADPVTEQKDHTSSEEAEETELGIDDKGLIVTKKKNGSETDVRIDKDSGKFRFSRKKQ